MIEPMVAVIVNCAAAWCALMDWNMSRWRMHALNLQASFSAGAVVSRCVEHVDLLY